MSLATIESQDAPLDLDGPASDPERVPPAGGLVPVSATETRERFRLEQTVGRSGPAAALARVGIGLRYLGSAQAARNGLRYRPVAWTLIALVALAFFLPGRVDWSSAPEPLAAPTPVAVAPPASVPDTGDTGLDVALPPPVSTPIPSSPTASAPPVVPPSSPSPTAAPPSTSPPGDRATTPLTVRGFGWAALIPPTPLPVDEVADGTAPVGMRLGSVDRVSFLRLSGADDVLELTEHSESAREAIGPAAVAVCPILEPDWAEEPGQSFEDAPTWDEASCVAGVENDGVWTFDLSSFTSAGDDTFGPVVGDAGFALVPTDEAPPDFNVAFTMPTSLGGDA